MQQQKLSKNLSPFRNGVKYDYRNHCISKARRIRNLKFREIIPFKPKVCNNETMPAIYHRLKMASVYRCLSSLQTTRPRKLNIAHFFYTLRV